MPNPSATRVANFGMTSGIIQEVLPVIKNFSIVFPAKRRENQRARGKATDSKNESVPSLLARKNFLVGACGFRPGTFSQN